MRFKMQNFGGSKAKRSVLMSSKIAIQKTEQIADTKHTHKSIKLKYNLAIDSVIDAQFLNKKSWQFVGNKASNFAILHKLSQKYDFKVP